MAKIPQIDTSVMSNDIVVTKIRCINPPKLLTKEFAGVPRIVKEGMVYDLQLNAIRIGRACIPISNIAEFEIAE